MSWFDITFACGHDTRIQLYGNRRDRDRRAEWFASQECRDCERAATNARSSDRAIEAGLPQMTGSDAQIAWAITLRDEALTDLDQNYSADDPVRDRARAILLRETRSRRWIDERCSTARSALRNLAAPGEHRDLHLRKDDPA